MIAYRLHFEEANLQAIEIVQSGKLGRPRLFASTFTMQVKEGNIRLQREMGGGTLYDIGIYCINAARYLFRAEPTEVVAFRANGEDARFRDVEEGISAIMRFPEDRMANFVCSFGGADVSAYEVVGSKGSLRLDPAYELASELTHHLTHPEKPGSPAVRGRGTGRCSNHRSSLSLGGQRGSIRDRKRAKRNWPFA
jgi:predicted dehydrogenase